MSHAIELANASDFGLSGTIWTSNESNAKASARGIQSGGIFVNGFSASDPRVPIGGVKKSGYGRELSHFWIAGIYECANRMVRPGLDDPEPIPHRRAPA